MILEIDIYRYTDKDASLLSLKKKTQTKQRSFDLFNICLSTIKFFSFDIIFNRQLQVDLITIYRILPQGNEFAPNAPNAHKYILSTITDLFIF